MFSIFGSFYRPLLKLGALALAALIPMTTTVAQTRTPQGQPILIGEINSYTGGSAFTLPYKKGIELAVQEVNAKGGVLGRPLEIVYRDDNLSPADAVKAANDLVLDEKVDLLMGGFSSSVGLALDDFATRQKKLYVATEPLTDDLVWKSGSKYVFRMRTSIYMLTAMVVKEAAANPAKRWATVSPNFEGGQAFVREFKKQLSALRPDIVWVGEQWPAPNKLDAGPTVDALERMNPEAILNVTYGPDLLRLVREGNTRGIFKNKFVVSVLSGEPEYLAPLKEETPVGWLVTGYVVDDPRPEHVAFLKAYEKKYGESPRFGSLIGYMSVQAVAQAIAKAGSTDTEKMVAALKGLQFQSPMGNVTIRAADHQATTGAWIGTLAQKDEKGYMANWKFLDGAGFLPSEADALKLRPATANQ